MPSLSLGDVCTQLGLLTAEQVTAVEAGAGPKESFVDAAVRLGSLDDEGRARALAQALRLNLVPGGRVATLSIRASVLALVPAEVARAHLVVPTFLDAERGVLTLLVADPTDVVGLKAVQTAARAGRLRLFVGPRSAMGALVERLYAPNGASAEETGQGRTTVVYEPDAQRAEVMRRLEALEGRSAEVLETLAAVTAAVEDGEVERIFYRRGLEGVVSALVADWRRIRPTIQLCPLDGFGVGARPAVRYEQARDFLVAVVERLVASRPGYAAAARRHRLVRAMAEVLEAEPEVVDAAAILALLLDVEVEPVAAGGRAELSGLGRWLAALDPPWDLAEACGVLDRRFSGQEGPTGDLATELVYTAATAVRAGVSEGSDPVARLGADAARHDGALLGALTEVLSRVGADLRPAGAAGAMSGRLEDLALPELLQLLGLGGKTALVRVRGANQSGAVQVRRGRIVAARGDYLVGDEALFALVALDEGTFDVWFADLMADNLAGASEFLLLEALRVRDERRAREGRGA